MAQRFLEQLLTINLYGIKQKYQKDKHTGRLTQLDEQFRELVKEEQTRLFQGALEPYGHF